MVAISLCMIVRDEAEVICRCLGSVRGIADEIVIVDTGSTDRTKAMAAMYTDKIHDFAWSDDFAAARNFAFSRASLDYVLWLDADDVLLEPDREKLSELKRGLAPSVDAVSMAYHLAFDEAGNVTSVIRRNRLVRRAKRFRWFGAVHEYLAVDGCIVDSDIAVTHQPVKHDADRNLRIFERRRNARQPFTPRDMFYYANECLDHGDYEQANGYYRQFLDSPQGWIEDKVAACEKSAECYYRLGDSQREREYALRSFSYDIPRAESCCRLGYGFMQESEWRKAVFWYKLASELKKPEGAWGFFHEPCWTWLPHLQLCVCHDRLGEYEAAYAHNEIARKYRPNDELILHNKEYLETVMDRTPAKERRDAE